MDLTSGEERLPPPMTPVVRAIIAVNIAVYFLQIALVGDQDMFRALAWHSGGPPWTIFTYSFVHAGFWHLLSNLWLLFVFGPRLEQAVGGARFIAYYLWCAVGGWLAHVIFVSHGIGLLGASAAIFGVLLAYAVRWPDDEVAIFPFMITVKVRWLVAFLAFINLLFGVTAAGGAGGIAYTAHLGGFVAGMIFIYAAAAPGLDRVRQRVSSVPDEPEEPPRAVPRPPVRTRERVSEADDAVARSNAAIAQPPARSVPLATRVGRRKTEELDHVLDKISRLGIDSLTAEERMLLVEMSKQLRDR